MILMDSSFHNSRSTQLTLPSAKDGNSNNWYAMILRLLLPYNAPSPWKTYEGQHKTFYQWKM